MRENIKKKYEKLLKPYAKYDEGSFQTVAGGNRFTKFAASCFDSVLSCLLLLVYLNHNLYGDIYL